MITREQAVYKIARARDIVKRLEDGTIHKLPYCERINIAQELREIRRDLIIYRRENPDA
jgi:hypothetical protein